MSTDADQTTLASAGVLTAARRAPSTQIILRTAVALISKYRPHTITIPWRLPYHHHTRAPPIRCNHLHWATMGSTRAQMATPYRQITLIARPASQRAHHMEVPTLNAQGMESHRVSPWDTKACNMDTIRIPRQPTARPNRHQCLEGQTTAYRHNSPGSRDGWVAARMTAHLTRWHLRNYRLTRRRPAVPGRALTTRTRTCHLPHLQIRAPRRPTSSPL